MKCIQRCLLPVVAKQMTLQLSFLSECLWARDSGGAAPGPWLLVSHEPAGPVSAEAGVSSEVSLGRAPSPACLWGGGRVWGWLSASGSISASPCGSWLHGPAGDRVPVTSTVAPVSGVRPARPAGGGPEPAERAGAATLGRCGGRLHKIKLAFSYQEVTKPGAPGWLSG